MGIGYDNRFQAENVSGAHVELEGSFSIQNEELPQRGSSIVSFENDFLLKVT